MNIFILYHVSTGKVYGSPYQGDADEWTNFPEEGLSVIGPIKMHEADALTIDCLQDPELYLIVDGQVATKPDKDAILTARALATESQPPTLAEQLLSMKERADLDRKIIMSLRMQVSSLQNALTATPSTS